MRNYQKIQWHKNKIMSYTFSGWLGVGQDGPRWLTPRCTPDLLHVFLIFLGRGGYQNHVFPMPTTKTLDQLETQCVLTYKLQTRTLPLLPTFQWAKQITQPSFQVQGNILCLQREEPQCYKAKDVDTWKERGTTMPSTL